MIRLFTSAMAARGRALWWALSLSFGLVLTQHGIPADAATTTSLVTAAQDNDIAAVRRLLRQAASANSPANDGSTALLWAAYHANIEMAKDLLAAGAIVDTPNRYGVTPLLQASRTGDTAMIKVLLDAGADPARWHAEGETPLMAAARTGHVDAIELLLAKGAFVNATDPFQEQTALMWAAAEGHVDAVNSLLKAGADANLRARVTTLEERKNADHPSGGFTALMFAVRNGHRAAARALMKGGADPKVTNADGLTATMIAIINDRFDLAKELLDWGADPNDGSLYFAVEMHDQTTDTRAQDATRMQPDHPNQLTALALVKILLDLGADPNKPFVGSIHSSTMCCPPKINSSPFYRAATAADVEVLKLLIPKGAQLEWSPAEIIAAPGQRPAPALNGNVGRTPVMMAMKGGGGPAIQGGPGYTRTGPPPFREPGSRDPLEALEVLLKAGANPNAKAPDGSTPIHQAVQAGKIAMIRALAGAGGSLEIVNKDNQTPLILAETIARREAQRKDPVDPPSNGIVRKVEKDSAADVVAALREMMHLSPNDPTPQPPPLSEGERKNAPGGNRAARGIPAAK